MNNLPAEDRVLGVKELLDEITVKVVQNGITQDIVSAYYVNQIWAGSVSESAFNLEHPICEVRWSNSANAWKMSNPDVLFDEHLPLAICMEPVTIPQRNTQTLLKKQCEKIVKLEYKRTHRSSPVIEVNSDYFQSLKFSKLRVFHLDFSNSFTENNPMAVCGLQNVCLAIGETAVNLREYKISGIAIPKDLMPTKMFKIPGSVQVLNLDLASPVRWEGRPCLPDYESPNDFGCVTELKLRYWDLRREDNTPEVQHLLEKVKNNLMELRVIVDNFPVNLRKFENEPLQITELPKMKNLEAFVLHSVELQSITKDDKWSMTCGLPKLKRLVLAECSQITLRSFFPKGWVYPVLQRFALIPRDGWALGGAEMRMISRAFPNLEYFQVCLKTTQEAISVLNVVFEKGEKLISLSLMLPLRNDNDLDLEAVLTGLDGEQLEHAKESGRVISTGITKLQGLRRLAFLAYHGDNFETQTQTIQLTDFLIIFCLLQMPSLKYLAYSPNVEVSIPMIELWTSTEIGAGRKLATFRPQDLLVSVSESETEEEAMDSDDSSQDDE